MRAGAGGGNGPHDAAGCCNSREQSEAGTGEVLGDIRDPERVAEVGFVGSENPHRLLIGNADERRIIDGARASRTR